MALACIDERARRRGSYTGALSCAVQVQDMWWLRDVTLRLLLLLLSCLLLLLLLLLRLLLLRIHWPMTFTPTI
jgi:hypothetical protein